MAQNEKDWGLHIYAIDPMRGPLDLGWTFANQSDTVEDVERRIVSDVLSNIEGLGRSTPINMVAVHIDGKRMDHEVDFRDPTKLFTDAIKRARAKHVLDYRSFDVIIEVDDGSNQNNNRGRSSTRSSPSTRSVSRSARSRSRASTRSPSTRSTSKHSRSRSTSRNSTLKKRQHQ